MVGKFGTRSCYQRLQLGRTHRSSGFDGDRPQQEGRQVAALCFFRRWGRSGLVSESIALCSVRGLAVTVPVAWLGTRMSFAFR